MHHVHRQKASCNCLKHILHKVSFKISHSLSVQFNGREVGTQDKGRAGFEVSGVVGSLLTDRVREGSNPLVVGKPLVGVHKACAGVVVGNQGARRAGGVACCTEVIGWVEEGCWVAERQGEGLLLAGKVAVAVLVGWKQRAGLATLTWIWTRRAKWRSIVWMAWGLASVAWPLTVPLVCLLWSYAASRACVK